MGALLPPWVLRYLLARRPALCDAVRPVFQEAVFGFYRVRAANARAQPGRTGAVNRIQRFGSALNLSVHFHAPVLDGVYTIASPFARPKFRDAPELTEEDVRELVERIRARVLRLLRTRGLLMDDGDVSLGEVDEQGGLLPFFQAASIQGRVAQGPDAGAPLERLNRIAASGSRFRPPPLCGEVDGFSLHAAVRIAADDCDRLEHLCRYVARPPFASERLSLTPDGRVVHELRRAWCRSHEDSCRFAFVEHTSGTPSPAPVEAGGGSHAGLLEEGPSRSPTEGAGGPSRRG